MIQRMTNLFLRTLREHPADAELPGHRLLVRAGYIRRAAPGIYTWLPVGLKVLNKVADIVRDEMNNIGAQELTFPALLPREPYEATGRWEEYGDNLFRLKDRKEGDYLLGPTHEEMFTLAVKDMFSSYKELPISLYQIQNKYRDEARPRGGLLRGREFIMKDSYSFNIDTAGLQESYDQHRAAYIKIFDRLGFDYVIVKATSGAMGGSASEEFLAVSEHGEDTFVTTADGSYAANVEAVETAISAPIDHTNTPANSVIDTPDSATIETLVKALNTNHPHPDGRDWTAADTLKNVVVNIIHPDGTRTPLAVGIPGDREVDMKRLEAQVEPLEIEPFTDADFKKHPGLVRGYIGPQALGEESATGVRYVVDPLVAEGSAWVTGANEAGKHVVNLVMGRDFTPDGRINAAEVRDGDLAPDGKSELKTARGIEMGHIFQLGTKYSDALDLKVLDQNGKQVVVQMGSYGVGVTRAVAAIAEATCDDIGLCWPREIAPYDVHVIAAGKGEEIAEAALKTATALSDAGLDVLFDDRPKVSPGVKFKDGELLGVPTLVTAGRGVADGVLEVKDRKTGEKTDVALDAIVDHIQGLTG